MVVKFTQKDKFCGWSFIKTTAGIVDLEVMDETTDSQAITGDKSHSLNGMRHAFNIESIKYIDATYLPCIFDVLQNFFAYKKKNILGFQNNSPVSFFKIRSGLSFNLEEFTFSFSSLFYNCPEFRQPCLKHLFGRLQAHIFF